MPGPKRFQSPPNVATVAETSAALSRDMLFSWSRVSGGSAKTPRRASPSKSRARRRPYQSGKWMSRFPGFPTAAAIVQSGTFALTLVPPRNAPVGQKPRDVVFVLDRSGSMSGWKMVTARRALGS